MISTILINPLVATNRVTLGAIDNQTNLRECHCVVFRLDDVQDGWLENAQQAVLDTFISKNQSLSLGIIMNSIGYDHKIVNKILEGKKKGLFELGLHGWNHVYYASLSPEDQYLTLRMANAKMEMLFGDRSNLFIAPHNSFDQATLDALVKLNIHLFSAAIFTDKNPYSTINQTTNNSTEIPVLFHLPGMTAIKFQEGNIGWVQRPALAIISDVKDEIAKYGYSIIITHPQDYAVYVNGKFTDSLDTAELQELQYLVDTFVNMGIKITTIGGIVEQNGDSTSNSTANTYSTISSEGTAEFNKISEILPTINDIKNGNALINAKVGIPFALTGGITNDQNNVQPCVTLFELRDENGVTMYLGWYQGKLNAFEYRDIKLYPIMVSYPGSYLLRTFTISDFMINSTILSPVLQSTVQVNGNSS